MTSEELIEKIKKIGEVYIPSYPIEDKQLFSGRTNQLVNAISIVDRKGLHGIIYGDRGVGKTSFSNILRIMYAGPNCQVIKISSNSQDSFEYQWYNILSKITIQHKSVDPGWGFMPQKKEIDENYSLSEFIDKKEVTVSNIVKILGFIPGDAVIIIDEFDRLQEGIYEKRLLTDLIKSVSDNLPNITMLLIGVSEDVSSLIEAHGSIERNLSQIYMPVMTPEEITKIIKLGEQPLSITFKSESIASIVELSSGYPHFTHSLCYYAAQSAIYLGHNVIDLKHINIAIKQTIDNAQESLKNGYREATLATKTNIFKEVLFAASTCETDEYGYFQARDLIPILEKVLDKTIMVNNFTFHLGKFTSPERGDILKVSGSKNRQKYKFKNPLMKAFIRLNNNYDSKQNAAIS